MIVIVVVNYIARVRPAYDSYSVINTPQVNTVFLVLALIALLHSKIKKFEAMEKKRSVKLAM